jgi:hypothetical protein
MTDMMTTATVRDAAFSAGDCRDAVLGTFLRTAGVPHPEEILFGELDVVVERTSDAFRNLVIGFRTEDAMRHADAAGVPSVKEVRAAGARELLEWVHDQVSDGVPVAVTVDHFEYERSQFHHSGHMPHHLIVSDVRDDIYEILDPYPYSTFDGRVDRAQLLRWTDSEHLLDARFYAFTLRDWRADAHAVRRFLGATWRDTVRRNVTEMLDGGDGRGTQGIELIADRLQEWVDSAGFADDVARRRKMPTTSFLEAGAIRRGHAMWLRRVAGLGHPELTTAADAFTSVGRHWDVVSTVRHTYQETGASDRPAEFLLRKLAQVPRLVRLVAEAERQAVEQLAEIAP